MGKYIYKFTNGRVDCMDDKYSFTPCQWIKVYHDKTKHLAARFNSHQHPKLYTSLLNALGECKADEWIDGMLNHIREYADKYPIKEIRDVEYKWMFANHTRIVAQRVLLLRNDEVFYDFERDSVLYKEMRAALDKGDSHFEKWCDDIYHCRNYFNRSTKTKGV